ncbi:MAG: ABC transporter ATP-binding protein [Clostridiales bacterium]|nr:ABC transporter ATP-binding protein [Clostridiales bacterium]MDD6937363.1 ABC transporter ATP-binding protein [Clostridiales bacterium]MDY2961482.1 ABC transporter ATP-binding protein [Oscillospiraceae bacterium]
MLEVQGLTVGFGGHTVLRGVDFTLPRGARAALMGPSGSGKTTFLRVLAGLQKPDSGTVRVPAQKIACVFQEPRLLPWLTAAQNVNVVLSDREETLPQAAAWLERFGLGGAAAQYPAELSGGMQQRVALARAMAYGADLLLLDEPFKAMDDALRRSVMQTVADAAGDAAVLLVTHSAEEAEALGCMVYQYENGTFL